MNKPGDWYCPSCNDLQFARNQQCRKCGAANPNGGCGGGGGGCGGGGGMQSGGPMSMKPGDWYCPACKDLQFARNARCNRCGEANPSPTNASGTSVPQKPGDWICPACGDLQFARNTACRRCGTANPNPAESMRALKEALASAPERIQKPGDWNCPNCGELVFARNSHCRKCMTANPNSMETGGVFSMLMGDMGGPTSMSGGKGCAGCGALPPRTGDWLCPSCGDLQFARNMQCKRCGTPNPGALTDGGVVSAPPTQAMMPGDWICPGCNDLVFARNDACRRCNTLKSAAMATASGQKGAGMMSLAGMSPSAGRSMWPWGFQATQMEQQQSFGWQQQSQDVASWQQQQQQQQQPRMPDAMSRQEQRASWQDSGASQQAAWHGRGHEQAGWQSSAQEPDRMAEQVPSVPRQPLQLRKWTQEDQSQSSEARAPPPTHASESGNGQGQSPSDLMAGATDHVYIKGLPEFMSPDWLPKFIQMEDKIVWCKIVWAKNGEAHALVQFESTDASAWAVENLNGQVSPEHGTRLNVAFHNTRAGPGKAVGPESSTAGSWQCPSCGGLVFRRQAQCQACGARRPSSVVLPSIARPAPY